MKMVTIIAVRLFWLVAYDTNRRSLVICATSAYGLCYEEDGLTGLGSNLGRICQFTVMALMSHSGKTRDCGSKSEY